MAAVLDRGIAEKYMKTGARIAVALSGGADSVCLLSLMKELSQKKSFELFALHLNHCIRGGEADRDEQFCRELCEGLGIPLRVKRIDVPALAKEKGQSLEEAAREARYAFFESEMLKDSISVIATAHNADDNAETVLLRIIRGSSLDGICGIRSERELSDGLTVIRPILAISKRDILEYCEKNGLLYVTDSTNACLDYPRNRIRARVLPEAEEINPSFLSVNARNCSQFARDAEFIGIEADKLYNEAVSGEAFKILPLIGRHRALVSRAVLRFCLDCGASPEGKHVEAICDAIERGGSYSQSIPEGKRIFIDGGIMYVAPDIRRKKARDKDEGGYNFRLSFGENRYESEGLCIDISIEQAPFGTCESEYAEITHGADGILQLSARKAIGFSIDEGLLLARSRRPNDRLGLGSFHKDLRRAMSEKRIAQPLRGVLPVICEGEEIIYVPCVGLCGRKPTRPNSQTVITVRLRLDTAFES